MKDFLIRYSFFITLAFAGLFSISGLSLAEIYHNDWFRWLWPFGLAILIWERIYSQRWICVCSNCGREVLDLRERYCRKCGAPTRLEREIKKMKICPQGHKLEDNFDLYKRCPKCGDPLQPLEPSFLPSKEEVRKKREEEKERARIKELITQSEKLIEEIIPGMRNPEFLAGLKIMKGELSQIFQQFEEKEISAQEAEERIFRLQEEAKILSLPLAGEETYYQILGIKEDASLAEIKESFRRMAKEFHPDQQPPQSKEWVKELAEERFKKINQAYEVLRDPKKRKKYDQEIGIRRGNK